VCFRFGFILLIDLWCLCEFIEDALIEIIAFDRVLELTAGQDLLATGTGLGFDDKHAVDQPFYVSRVDRGWLLIDSLDYPFVQLIHVLSPKGWVECKRFVQDTAKTPDVTLTIIRCVVPDFRTRIVGRASLGIQEAIFGYFRDV